MKVVRNLDLVREETSDCVSLAMGGTREEPFGIYVGAGDDPAAILARLVERAVFGESFGNSPTLLDTEYGPYEEASLFFCVIDHHRKLPVGMARAILPSAAGLKSLNDIANVWGQDVDDVLARTGLPLHVDATWDCASIATMPEYRKGSLFGLVSMALYQALVTSPVRNGFRWWIGIVDTAVLEVVQKRIGRPVSTYDGIGPMSYIGSAASVPVWSDLRAWSARLIASDPILHDIVFRGTGLEHGVSAPDWERVDRLVSELSPVGAAMRSSGSARTA